MLLPGFMTVPRQVLPNDTYLVTRRCSQRQFLLAPFAKTNLIFAYLLAVAAKRFEICVHVYCVLSNHMHLVVTDPHARLPAFIQYLDSLSARAINAMLGRRESFWGPSSYNAVLLVSPEDIVDKAAYVLANPVAAGLVRRGREWPGLWSAPEMMGKVCIRATRPTGFFRPDGPMPATAELELTAPPGFATPEAFREQLTRALEEKERQAQVALARSGQRFMGREKVLEQEPWGRPASREPLGGLKPRVAARDKRRRLEVLSRWMGFLRSYRDAWNAFRRGVRDVVFPAGTYWLRVNGLVRCAPVPG